MLGLIAGYYRGITDSLLTRAMDVMLAFPVLLLAIGLGVACADGCLSNTIKPGLTVVVTVIALSLWPYMARIVRGQVLSLREKEFVEAARSLGASNSRIIFREILPNLVAPIIVYGTILIPQVILFEAALSFLGIGIEPGTPSWGSMISDAVGVFDIAWWFMTFPGLALAARSSSPSTSSATACRTRSIPVPPSSQPTEQAAHIPWETTQERTPA